MTKEEIFIKFREILVSDFEIKEEEVTPGAKLYEDLDLDSIDAIDLMVKMKTYLSGKIESEQFKKAVTIQDVVDMLEPLTKTNSGL
jgi:acyl carrier protein